MTDDELRSQLTRHTVLLENIADRLDGISSTQIQQGQNMAVLSKHVEDISPKVHALEQDRARTKGFIAAISTVVSLVWAAVLGAWQYVKE